MPLLELLSEVSVRRRAESTRRLTLMADLHRRTQQQSMHVRALTDAVSAQRALIGQLRAELPERVAEARARAAAMCFDLAEQYKLDRRFEQV